MRSKRYKPLRARQEQAAALVSSSVEELPRASVDCKTSCTRRAKKILRAAARADFQALLNNVVEVDGVPRSAARSMYPTPTHCANGGLVHDKMGGVIALGAVIDKPLLIAATTKTLIQERSIHAGNLVRDLARVVDGGGGVRPAWRRRAGAIRQLQALDKVPASCGL